MIRRLILVAPALALCCGCAATETAKKPAAQPAPPSVATPSPAATTPTSTPRPSATPPGTPLRPEVSADEEHRLVESTKQSIGDVARAVAELEGRQMKPPQQEALRTAKNFLDQARSAMDQKDYQRAANLASKARTLTDGVAGATK